MYYEISIKYDVRKSHAKFLFSFSDEMVEMRN